MTAVLNWDIVSTSGSDADLVRACAAGEKRAFAMIYGRYADRLHDFCVGMLGDRDSAADCVHDAFCTAATQLPQLRDPDKLRPWLYSIARNEALRRIRDRRRETPTDDLPDSASGDAGPETMAARLELADLISDAAGGLSDRDRAVLELAFRHGLNGPDLADALEVTPANANTIVHRLRQNIERSLGALLVSRSARNNNGCAELADILDGWDGHFNVLMRKRISRHIESCAACDEERRRLVSPAALLGAAPVFVPAPAWLRDRTLAEVQLTSSAARMHAVETGNGSAESAARNHSWTLPVVALVAALIATVSAAALWVSVQKPTIPAPIQVGETAPAPPPSPATPLPPPTTATAQPLPAAEAPARRTSPVERPSAAPEPEAAPTFTEPTPAPPPPPVVLPPPPAWPDLPQWPQWPDIDPGGPDPNPGGQFTGPSDIAANPVPDPVVPG